jgi:cytochrome P450
MLLGPAEMHVRGSVRWITQSPVRPSSPPTRLGAGWATGYALTWALIALQDRPGIAAELQAEVDRVVGGPGNPILPEHLPGLEYTGMVLDETMRLYPPAWMLPRGVAEDARHKFAYHPFGGGIHRCLGEYLFNVEAKLALAALYNTFEMRTRAPRGTEPHGTIALRPRHQVLLDLSLRDVRAG